MFQGRVCDWLDQGSVAAYVLWRRKGLAAGCVQNSPEARGIHPFVVYLSESDLQELKNHLRYKG